MDGVSIGSFSSTRWANQRFERDEANSSRCSLQLTNSIDHFHAFDARAQPNVRQHFEFGLREDFAHAIRALGQQLKGVAWSFCHDLPDAANEGFRNGLVE